MAARAEAALRGATVGLRFRGRQENVIVRSYVDGNGNGIRTRDIGAGIDSVQARRDIVEAERFSQHERQVAVAASEVEHVGWRAAMQALDGVEGRDQ